MISDGFYNCGKCAYFHKNICILNKVKVTQHQYCANFSQELPICDNCHNIAPNPLYWTKEDGELKILC